MKYCGDDPGKYFKRWSMPLVWANVSKQFYPTRSLDAKRHGTKCRMVAGHTGVSGKRSVIQLNSKAGSGLQEVSLQVRFWWIIWMPYVGRCRMPSSSCAQDLKKLKKKLRVEARDPFNDEESGKLVESNAMWNAVVTTDAPVAKKGRSWT